MTDVEREAQRQIAREFMADKLCVSAWKPFGSLIILSMLPDHEPLLNLLFDSALKVEAMTLGDWHYYQEAKQPNIECWIVDDDTQLAQLESHLLTWNPVKP